MLANLHLLQLHGSDLDCSSLYLLGLMPMQLAGGVIMYTNWEFGPVPNGFDSQSFPIVPNRKIKFDQKWVFRKIEPKLSAGNPL